MKTFLLVLILSLALISTAYAQPVTWTQMPDAQPFAWAGSGVLGNYFYNFGCNLTPSQVAQTFNLTTEQWTASTPPPFGQAHYGCVATNGAIYLIGWFGFPSQVGADVQRFTPSGGGPTGTWTQMAPYPLPIHMSAVAWDGDNYIYVAGGYYGGSRAEAYRYDIAGNNWTQLAYMPIVNYGCGGAFIQGKFYVVGGWYWANTLLEYNPGNDTWTYKTGPPIGVPTAYHCTASNGSLLFTVGGGMGTAGSTAVQVYNPVTDSWTLDSPLPQGTCVNNAGFVPPDKVISAGGFLDPGVLQAATYRGVGFPTGGASYDLTVDLVPFVQPIQIPASGASFSFYAFVTNNDPTSHDVQLWTTITDPAGLVIGPVVGPVMVSLTPGTRGWIRQQNIPGAWIPGLYTYIAYAGYYGSTIWASDSLQFTKLTTGDGPWVGDWSCTGEEISNAEKPLITQHSSLFTSVQPNPFNPTTALSYELRDASYVSLNIYDTTGRLVTELANGWRDAGTHQITFDGSGLPSGIYFAKLRAGDYSQLQKLILLK